ncbi:MAG: hypothetical protein VB104_02750 [Candidatus Limiplasma sp.]|nr:hypothetical protein [Candidatus Limiplasma sp.]
MGTRTIKTRIELDGEKEFKTGLEASYQTVSKLYREMQIASATFDDNTSAMEKNAQKAKLLRSEIDAQKALVQSLAERLKYAQQAYGENSSTADEYASKLNKAMKALDGMEKNLASTEKAMDDLGDESVSASADLDHTAKSVDDVGEASQNAEAKARRLSDGFTVMKGVLSNLISDALRRGAEALKSFATESVDLGSDLQEVDNVVTTAFGNASKQVKDFAADAATQYGLSSLAAQEYSGKLGAAFNALGLKDRAVEMSTTLTGLSGDLASFWNLTADESYGKLFGGIISGETEGLKSLGIVMTQTNLDAFALSQGMQKSYQNMSEAEKATLRYQYVLNATKDAQGDFAKTSDSFANQARVSALNIDNLKASLGQRLLPSLQSVMRQFNDYITSDYAERVFGKLADAAGDLAEAVLPKVITAFTFVVEHIEQIGAAVAAISALAIGSKIAEFISSLTSLGDVLKGVAASQGLLNTVMTANPVGAVIVALGGLLAILGVLDVSINKAVDDAGYVAPAIEATVPAIESVIPSFEKYQRTVNNVGTATADMSKVLSRSGKTVSELDTAIQTAEDAITKIIKTAIEEQRSLRGSELEDIKKYNDQLLALQQEKLQMYRDTQIAELHKLALEEQTLTAEQAGKRLETIKAASDQANAVVENIYTTQLAMLENYHRANGTLNTTAYQTDQQAAYANYQALLNRNEEYQKQAIALVLQSSQSWIGTEVSKYQQLKDYTDEYLQYIQDGTKDGMANEEDIIAGAGWSIGRKWSQTMETLDLTSAKAFLQMILNAQKMGIDVDESSKNAASNILSAFQSLPAAMKDTGLNVLQGLIGGMEGEFSNLNDTSNLTADEIVNAIKTKLDIKSPSGVMKAVGRNIVDGLEDGMEDRKTSVSSVAANIGSLLLTTFKNMLGIRSPSTVMRDVIGKNIGLGVVEGINDSRKAVNAAVAGLIPESASMKLALDARDALAQADSYAGTLSMNQSIPGSLQTELSDRSVARISRAFISALEGAEFVGQMNEREMIRFVKKAVALS